MAAGAFTFYNKAKKKIGNGSINLAATVFRMSLVTSASNFATATLSTFASLTSEIADGNGYSTGSYKWDAADPVWTASGGTIANIKAAVIWLSAASAGGRHLVCYSQLSTSQFTLSTGNTMTVTLNSLGIATLQ
jgi:hypothetical protein